MPIRGPKDFYSIADFYNFIKQPECAPTTHRHFQVYFHPIIYEQAQIIPVALKATGIAKVTKQRDNSFGRGKSVYEYKQESFNNTNFYDNWFVQGIHERFSLAIQSITFPTLFGIEKQTISTPLGNYNHVSNDSFYGKLNESQISFTLIDQIIPLLETKINEWILEVYRAKQSKAYAGGVTPKVNIVIKYFRQDQVLPGTKEHPNNLSPNFIYYMTNAYPTRFQTCSIDHSGNDSEGDLRRSVTFNFDQLYVFGCAVDAQRFGLGYLFDPIRI